MNRYTLNRAAIPPEPAAPLDLPAAWQAAERGQVDSFHPRSSAHHPPVAFRALYDATALYVRFDVQDRYVLSVETRLNHSVCRDSCVEFFVKPKPDAGYFNFEINAGGTLLLSYIEDPARGPNGFAKWRYVDEAWCRQVTIAHSLPAVVDPEITAPTPWVVAYRIPLALFEAYAGALGALPGTSWRANFYKCADRTSHPHWGAWNPIGEVLNFHKPETFGELRFA